MKIDDNPKVVFSCPRDSLDEVIVLPLDIWFTRTDVVSPITYRDADMVESKIHDRAGSVGSIICPTLQIRTQQQQLPGSRPR
jgi:hypothetical protein